ncbi:hypothetical protein [Thermococcus sp.]|uniref:hypothetical protein n=1 Tax=Thermococcus sp. TaxID=35749 RepID=UPI0025F311FB|nr:hypothetical protein [Thermococcus sp.]
MEKLLHVIGNLDYRKGFMEEGGELKVKSRRGYKFYVDASTIHIQEVKKALEGLDIRVRAPHFSFV